MKTKPVLIIAGVLIIAVCGFLFVRSKNLESPYKNEIAAFLKDFSYEVKAGNTKAALAYFDKEGNKDANRALVKVLCNKTGIKGKGEPLFKIELDIDKATFDYSNPELTAATVPVNFTHYKVPGKESQIKFTIHKTGSKSYKILSAQVDAFATDYAAYQNKVINATTPETDIYSAETLAAFKIAAQLKTRYDSILWFQHVDKKPWFYVVKGTLPEKFYWDTPDDKPAAIDYKMGLIGPDLKEVVPVEYDLVHNIGGTIDSLIEVEKAGKKGLYNMAGKLVVPVSYDLILPLKEGDNLAVLKNEEDYMYLAKDLTIGEKIPDFKIADILPKVKYIAGSYTLNEKMSKNIMEYNDRDNSTSLVVSPSYLVEWGMLSKFMDFPDPLRQTTGEDDGSRSIDVTYDGSDNNDGNWFQTAFYSVVNDYLGGRGGLYETKKVLVVDKAHNKVMGFEADTYQGYGEGGGPLIGNCKQNSLRVLSDSLFEYKTTATLEQNTLSEKEYIQEGPYYTYLKLVNGKLITQKTQRVFPTQFAKLDDSYLSDCYLLTTITDNYDNRKSRTIDHANPAILQAMKNEIYASYRYRFKNSRWNAIFQKFQYENSDTTLNANVDDSLTAIDKYNIDFLNRKLKIVKPATLALR